MKKLIVSAETLKPALKILGQAVNEKAILPVTKNIYFKVRNGEAELVTTDIDNVISVILPAETSDADFELLIPFEFLSKVVAVSKNEPLVIEHPSARKVKILTENDLFELTSLDKTEEFPKLPAAPKKANHTLSEEFVKLMSDALLTVNKDVTRPALSRVMLDLQTGDVNIVSTDAIMMYKHRLQLEVAEPLQLQFSAKTIKALECMQQVEISWNKNMICLKGENITVWSRRYDDLYPNYKAVIPQGQGPNLMLKKADLIDGLHKAMISSIASTNTVLVLKKSAGFIHIEADDPDMSRNIHVKIPGQYEGDTESVCLNAKKMLTVLDQTDAKEVKLHIGGPAKAILISSDEAEGYLGLIMPLIKNR